MATIPYYIEPSFGSKSSNSSSVEPRLELRDFSDEGLARRSQPKTRRVSNSFWEGWAFNITVLALAVFVLVGCVHPVLRALHRTAPISVATYDVPVTVHQGDTLWGYAQHYGTSDTYILDRVQTIASANHISDRAALVPGEHLRIPVTNPVLVAEIRSRREIASR